MATVSELRAQIRALKVKIKETQYANWFEKNPLGLFVVYSPAFIKNRADAFAKNNFPSYNPANYDTLVWWINDYTDRGRLLVGATNSGSSWPPSSWSAKKFNNWNKFKAKYPKHAEALQAINPHCGYSLKRVEPNILLKEML